MSYKKTGFSTKLNERYNSYKSSAKARGHSFNLSKKQFHMFFGKNCFYCGEKIEFVGIDRFDNEMGYDLDNCVPCCSVCNKMKLNIEYEKFIQKCKQIVSVYYGNRTMFDAE